MSFTPSWLPYPLQERAAWMQNFAERFATLAVPLGFTAATVTQVEDDNEAFQYLASSTVEVETFAKAFRAYRDTVLDGEIGGRPPMFPGNPTAVPPNSVGAGLYERLDVLVKRIKVSLAYTPEVGALLGIVGGSTTRPPDDELQPTLKAMTLPGSVVQVKFTRKNMDGVLIETKVDNSETWSVSGRYYSSPAELVIPVNAQNLPRSVQLRARFVDGNTAVGQYSDVLTTATQPAV